MGNINTNVKESAAKISGINNTIHSMAATSKQVAASVGTVGEQVDFVSKDIQNFVGVVSGNTISLQEINAASAKLHDTAQAYYNEIEKHVEEMSHFLQEEKKKAEAARAGDAGKGFAEVAYNLPNQK